MVRPIYLDDDSLDRADETYGQQMLSDALAGVRFRQALPNALSGIRQIADSWKPLPIVVSPRPETVQQPLTMPSVMDRPPAAPQTPTVSGSQPQQPAAPETATSSAPPQGSVRPTGASGVPAASGPAPTGGGKADRYSAQIAQVAREEGVPYDVLAGLIDTESSGEDSVSPAGARGIMQVVPGQGYDQPGENAADPLTSIRQGARAVKDKYNATGSWERAGRAYFGYGVDAGGMTTDRYGQIYDANRARYQDGATSNASATPPASASPAAAAPAQPSAAGAPRGSGPIHVRDQWGNEWDTTQDSLNRRPGGYSDLTIVSSPTMQKVSDTQPSDNAGLSPGDQKRQKMAAASGGATPYDNGPDVLPNADAPSVVPGGRYTPSFSGNAPPPGPGQSSSYSVGDEAMYRQPLQATGGPDTNEGDGQASSYNDPTADGTLNQPLPTVESPYSSGGSAEDQRNVGGGSPADDPGGAQDEQPGAVQQAASWIGDKLKPIYDTAGQVVGYVQHGAEQVASGIKTAASDVGNTVATEGVATPIGRGIANAVTRPLIGKPPLEDSGQPETSIDRAIVETGRSLGSNISAARQGYESGDPLQAGMGVLGVVGDLAPSTTLARQLNEMVPKADTPLGDVGLGDVVMTAALVRDAARLGYGVIKVGGRIGASIARAISESVPAERFSEWMAANSGRVAAADARMAEQGSTVAGGVFGATPDSRRMYHGTAGEFARPDPGKFDENGLFGPGYYTTSDPRVASSYAGQRAGANGSSGMAYEPIGEGVARDILDRYGRFFPNEDTAVLSEMTGLNVRDLMRERATRAGIRAQEAQRLIDDAVPLTTGQNVRAVDVPGNLNLLDIDASHGDQVANQISDAVARRAGDSAAARFEEHLNPNPTGADIYEALVRAGDGDKYWANEQLRAAGFDGITHTGGQRVPLLDDAGKPIEHDVSVIFPHALDKITNGFSGEVGGATLGAGASPGGVDLGATGGPGRLGAVNRGLGQGIRAAAGGAIGAQLNQQANPDDPYAGVKGFAVGAVAPPLIAHGAGRLARAFGHEAEAAGGALATFGASPNGPRRRLTTQAERLAAAGAKPITSTAAEDVSRLRLDKFPSELQGDIQKGAEATGFAHEQRRGVLPDQAVQNLADTDTHTVDQWIKQGKAGKSYNAEETVALRNAVTTQADTVRDLTDRITSAQAEGLDPVLLTARRVAEAQKLAALVQTAEGARAEAGRTLRAYRATTRILESNDPADAARRILRNVSDDPEEAARLLESFNEVSQSGSPIDIAKFWSKVENPPVGWKDWFVALRYNSMLSGLSTHLVNIVGNATEIPWRLLRDTAASIGQRDLRPLGPELKGVASGFSAGLHAGWETLVHGLTAADAEAGGVPRDLINRARGPVEKGAALALEAPGRLLGAADQFGRQIAYHMGMGREAGLKASREGLKGPEWNQRVAELLASPPDELSKAAQGISDRMTFKGDMGRNGAALNGFLRKIDPVLANFIMPFMKTVYHITSRGIDRSPLGAVGTAMDVAKGKYAAGKTLEQGMVPLGERVGDNLMGTAVFGLGAYWALQGNLSASGPSDPADRDELRAQGWQPYSVKVGDKWVSYANLGPLAMPLSMAAATGESQRYKDASKPSEVQFLEGGKRFAEVFTEQTYLNSFGQLYKAMTDPVKYGDAYTTSFLGSLVPYGSALNAAGQAMDPSARRPERMQDVGAVENARQSLASRNVPFTGGRGSVPVAQDVLGREDPNIRYGFDAGNPFRVSQDRPDPTLQAVQQSGVNISRPPDHLALTGGAQVPLTPAEQRQWQRERGALLQQFAGKFSDAPWWQNPDAREKAMRSLMADANQAASAKVQAAIGSPELIRRAREAAAQKKAS